MKNFETFEREDCALRISQIMCTYLYTEFGYSFIMKDGQ